MSNQDICVAKPDWTASVVTMAAVSNKDSLFDIHESFILPLPFCMFGFVSGYNQPAV